MELNQVELLERLADLKAKGVISEDEFNQQKSSILTSAAVTAAYKPPPIPHAMPEAVGDSGTLWFPIPSMVLGIICVLATMDDSPWDRETVEGMIMFGVMGVILGIVTLTRQKKGRGMAIAGIVMCSLGMLVALAQ